MVFSPGQCDKVISSHKQLFAHLISSWHVPTCGTQVVASFTQDGLWYDGSYPESETMSTWETMAARYKDTWNVYALDCFNEPFSGMSP